MYAGIAVLCWLQCFRTETLQHTVTAAMLLSGLWALTLYQLARFIFGESAQASAAPEAAAAAPAAAAGQGAVEGAFPVRTTPDDARNLRRFLSSIGMNATLQDCRFALATCGPLIGATGPDSVGQSPNANNVIDFMLNSGMIG